MFNRLNFGLRGKSLSVAALVLLCMDANAGPFAYITNQSSNTVSVVDTATDTLTATIPVGTRPRRLAINAFATELYVSNLNSNTVSVINTDDSSPLKNTVVATIPVGNGPAGVVYSVDGTKVYVVNSTDSTVSVIDTVQRQVIGTITVGPQVSSGFFAPHGIAIQPSGQKVFVVNGAGNSISVIDTATNTSSIPISVSSPTGAALSLDGSKLYVVNQVPSQSVQISIFDTATYAQIGASIPTSNANSVIGGATMGQDGSQFCLTQNASQIHCLNTSTLQLTTTAGGAGLFGYLDFTPSGSAYLPILQAGQLRHLTLPAGTIQANVALGSGTQPVQVVLGRVPVVSGTAPIGLVGANYSFTPQGYGGVTYSATGLPAGVSINPNTGLVSGTPTQAGTYTPTITLTNQAGSTSFSPSFVVYDLQALPDSASTPVNTAISSTVSTNDIVLPAGTTVTYTLMTGPTSGTVVFDPATGAYTYTPNANFTGSDSFTYQICLPAPNATVCSVSAPVNITVSSATPGAPVINDASYTTQMNTPVSANAGTGGQVPSNSVFQALTPPAHGQLTIDPATGAFTYTPNANYVGADTATVRVCLPAPNSSVCDDAVLTFNVQRNGGGTSATPVPTLGTLGLIGLSSVLSLFGLTWIRRRPS